MTEPHPKNAPGPFYVENGMCLACTAPFHEAPDLMGTEHGQGDYHCHFRKQPETPAEVERAVMACRVSCVEAVRYAGNDPAILQRFRELGAETSCDVLSRPSSVRPGKLPLAGTRTMCGRVFRALAGLLGIRVPDKRQPDEGDRRNDEG